MFLRGTNVLRSEIQGCMKIPEEQRMFYKDHITIDDGEGEPHGKDDEIIIQSNMNAKNIYSFKIKW